MHTKSTAASYKPTIKLTAHRGWYRVQSGTTPGVFYETSANTCTCPAHKPCKHMRFVRSLNVAFFVKKETQAPGAPAASRAATTSGYCTGSGNESFVGQPYYITLLFDAVLAAQSC